MQKKVLLFGVLFLFLLVLPVILAADANLTDDSTDSQKIDAAYTCLRDKIDERTCSVLTSEEKIFSLLAAGKCKSEVLSDSNENKCWPKSGCNIKTTAQAILALDNSGSATSTAEDWLIAKNTTPTNLDWLLEIESNKATTCKIKYSGNSYTVNIGEDKKIDAGAGTCLTLSEGNWWLQVSQNCYGIEFEISCDESFFTTLLFKKRGSSTVHVSENINSESAEGQTIEKVNTACFGASNVCDYEGTLWASLVLEDLGYDTAPYIPYLIAMSDDNDEVLPEAFLYPLTGEFNDELLAKQNAGGYWDESGDKFYDTAVAMLSLKDDSLSQTSLTQTWLFDVQAKDGCWAGIKNTAFLLYSIWPGATSDDTTTPLDCEDLGYYCMSGADCTGSILDQYDCAVAMKCCDTSESTGSCLDEGGVVCDSDEECSGSEKTTSDLSYGETCCVSGTCQPVEEISACEEQAYDCRYECLSDEEPVSYDCTDSSDSCCAPKTTSTPSGKSYWWIWVLAVLIILVILGIVFKEKLKPYWFKLQSKFKGSGKSSSSSGSPRGPPGMPPRMMPSMQRTILPPSGRPQQRMISPSKPKSDIDDVLKKLKEMGK